MLKEQQARKEQEETQKKASAEPAAEPAATETKPEPAAADAAAGAVLVASVDLKTADVAHQKTAVGAQVVEGCRPVIVKVEPTVNKESAQHNTQLETVTEDVQDSTDATTDKDQESL